MEKIIGIHLDIPRNAVNIITDALRKTKIRYPRNYSYVPHITLYLCRFPARQFPKLVKSIASRKIPAVYLHINKVSGQKQKNSKTFLSLVFRRSVPIQRLHRQIVLSANKLRGSLIRTKDQKRLKQDYFSKQEEMYLKEYGSPRVLALYKPHITLGEVPLSAVRQSMARFNPFLRKLKKMELPLATLVVGLYEYDNYRLKYTKVIQEKKISLN
jgi:hypothetical protein